MAGLNPVIFGDMQGIVYIALGDRYFDMAVKSAQSVINNYVGTCPPILIFNEYGGYLSLDGINKQGIVIEVPYKFDVAAAYLKTLLNSLSPFEQTLYLDCDTKAVGDLSGIWDYCGSNIAVAPAYSPLVREADYYRIPEAELTTDCLSTINDFRQYNTGVLLFRKSKRISEIFDLWSKEWCIFKNHENMAFTQLVTYGLPVDDLPSIYNQYYPDRSKDSILIHYIDDYKKYL